MPTPDPRPGGRAARVQQAVHEAVRALLAIREYAVLMLVAALVGGSHAMHDSFAVIRWGAAGIGPGTAGLLWSESVAAEVMVFFIITVAAAEVAVGLALIVALYRKRQSAHVEDLTSMKN